MIRFDRSVQHLQGWFQEPKDWKNFVARCALVLLLVGAVVGCQKPAENAAAPPPPKVTVSLPLQREVTDWDQYTGHLQSPETVNVSARISGFIEEAPFKEGALVKKGDILFVIDDRPYKADLQNKEATAQKDVAQLDLARTQLDRYADLLKKRTISQQDYDTNKATYEQSEAQLAADKAAAETARLNLEWTRVTAPIAGRVSRMSVTPGNLVNGGAGQATLLTTIVSVDPMYCYVPVPERSFLRYQAYAAKVKGASVRDAKIPCYLQLENEVGFPHEGYVDFIDNSLDPGTGTIQLRGVVSNPDGALTPGLFAVLRITGSGPYQTLLVPDVAVGSEQNERFLLVVGSDDVVASRRVKLGGLFGKLRSIVEGLKPEDRVVVNGLQMARPGQKVSPQETPIPPEAVTALDAAINGMAYVPGLSESLAAKSVESKTPAKP